MTKRDPKWKLDADREFLRVAMMKHFSEKLTMDEIGNFIYDVVPVCTETVQSPEGNNPRGPRYL